jgi:hypothetical protein
MGKQIEIEVFFRIGLGREHAVCQGDDMPNAPG